MTLPASSHKGGAKTEVGWHRSIALAGALSCTWVALLVIVWLLRFVGIGQRWPEPDQRLLVEVFFRILEAALSEGTVERCGLRWQRYSASRNFICIVSLDANRVYTEVYSAKHQIG